MTHRVTGAPLSGFERFPRVPDTADDSPAAHLAQVALAVGSTVLGADGEAVLPRRQKSSMTRFRAVVFALLIAAGGLFAGMTRLRAGETLPGTVILIAGGIIAVMMLGMAPQRAPRGPFRFINATVMTRAERPTADSWVHLAPTQSARPTLILGVLLGSLAMLAAGAYGALQVLGVVPTSNPSTTPVVQSFAAIAIALIGCFGIWISALLIGRRRRNGSYGAMPSGVALGESSVAVRIPGRDVEIPWTRIGSVEPVIVAMPDGEELPLTRLNLLLGGPIRGTAQMLSADGYQVPSDALFTALRWYHAHPEARHELGRVEGQRRLQGWCEEALLFIR